MHCGSLERFPQVQHLALIGNLFSTANCLHATESDESWPSAHQPYQRIEGSYRGGWGTTAEDASEDLEVQGVCQGMPSSSLSLKVLLHLVCNLLLTVTGIMQSIKQDKHSAGCSSVLQCVPQRLATPSGSTQHTADARLDFCVLTGMCLHCHLATIDSFIDQATTQQRV